MEQQEFDLLALHWWQNPWYWLLLLTGLILLIIVALLLLWRWYRVHYRATTPEEALLQALIALEKAPFATVQEQKAVCSAFIIAYKKYAQMRFNCAVDHLSDQEFVQVLRNTACSQVLVDDIAALLDMATRLKFAPLCEHAELFLAKLAHSKQTVASLLEGNQRN
jgi:hypothetical protein